MDVGRRTGVLPHSLLKIEKLSDIGLHACPTNVVSLRVRQQFRFFLFRVGLGVAGAEQVLDAHRA